MDLTTTDKPTIEELRPDDLSCLLILTQRLCQGEIPKYQIDRIFKDVVQEARDKGIKEESIERVLRAALKERWSNGLNAILDRINFW